MKSVRSNPTVHAVEGDERIRTAVCEPGALPVYDDRGKRVAVIGRDARVRDLRGRLLPGGPDWPLRFSCEIVAARAGADRG